MRLDLWSRRALLGIVVIALCFGLAGLAAEAGQSGFQGNAGFSFFSTDAPCPARQFPAFESLIPIPSFVDPFEQDIIPVFCQIFADDDKGAKKGVKGRYTSELVMVDNNTGETERVPVGSGRFRTNRDGFDSFDFDIPTELFADGFESGDVSAWSYTRSDFRGTKRVQSGGVSCEANSSKSSGN